VITLLTAVYIGLVLVVKSMTKTKEFLDRLVVWSSGISITCEDCTIICFLVCNRACHNCQKEVYYDGSLDGLLNMTTYLVGHDILREYMHSFLHGK
jgi:hypothetical protein